MQPQIHRPTCNADKCVIGDLVPFHILSMAHGLSMSHRSPGLSGLGNRSRFRIQ